MTQDKLVEYFIDETNKRLDRIDEKLERLISFRLILIGVAMTVSTIVSVIVQFFNK